MIRTAAQLVIAILLLCSTAQAKPDRAAHVALIVDGRSDIPDVDLCSAAVELIQRLKSVDHLGLWKTDETIASLMPMSALGSSSAFTKAKKRTASICKAKTTQSNLQIALEEVVEKLSEYPAANVSGTRAVVILYAGNDNGDPESLKTLKRRLARWRIAEDKSFQEKCPEPNETNTCACNARCDRHVAIHSIAIGADADNKLLSSLATASGGAYYKAEDQLQLKRSVQRVAANLIRARGMQQVVGTNLKLRKTPRKYNRDEDDEDDLAYKFPSDYYPSTEEESNIGKTGAWVWWLIGFALCLCIAGLLAPFIKRRTQKPPKKIRESQMTAMPPSTLDTDGYFSQQTGEIKAPEWETGTSPIVHVRFQAQLKEHESFTISSNVPSMTIGRRNNNNIVITNATCSGTHAELRWRRGRLTIEDLNSSNGTFVNDQRIDSSTLTPGDIVKFGSISFEVIGNTEVSLDTSKQSDLYDDTLEDTFEELHDERLNELVKQEPEEEPSGPAQCDMHPLIAAIKSCDSCKRPFCSQCLERVLDRDLCFEDLCTECRNGREDI